MSSAYNSIDRRGRGRRRQSTMLIFEGEPWQAMIDVSIANRIEFRTSTDCSEITRAPFGQLMVEPAAFDVVSWTSQFTPQLFGLVCCPNLFCNNRTLCERQHFVRLVCMDVHWYFYCDLYKIQAQGRIISGLLRFSFLVQSVYPSTCPFFVCGGSVIESSW